MSKPKHIAVSLRATTALGRACYRLTHMTNTIRITGLSAVKSFCVGDLLTEAEAEGVSSNPGYDVSVHAAS
jgi:hypothetical protein